ncbi:phosphoribosylanthranilate isomerase [Sabulicella rubraurantiaca]|uniref:phosphoribosylanthranilate isomerase n=1 Tax=Sabulicella rubraurantiaca TaxID=2811429 RepID=UPI001A96C43A|nr:phosphoribosylanthranilate isomerase [Sabulicella rubraurantiaca]
MTSPLVKICGLRDAQALEAAREADFVGFVFYPASPRSLSPDQAIALAAVAPAGPKRVGLFVDATDALIAAALPALDVIQLHGNEDPARVAEIRSHFGKPVMKAIGIGSEADLRAIADFVPVADYLLLDAKPAELPGGNGTRFDWSLPRRAAIPRPWLLAGGLDAANVAAALAESGAPGVDVSSGVEVSRGVKDPALIAAFVKAARGG